MKIRTRIISLAIAALMLAALAALVVPAAALPVYEPSKGYASGKYYASLSAYAPTGDQRYDTVAIALTQLGYHEGDSDLDFDGMNTSGGKNVVEYNRIFGKVDNGEGNGVSYGYAWCAAFVSFCLRQAGVAESAAVTEISCIRMVNWYRAVRNRTAWQGAEYTPTPGDLIFFKTGTSSAVSTHVGIVIGVKDGMIYTVEGNNGGCVATHVYAANNSTIVGYGIPDYSGAPAVPVYDFSLEVTDARLGDYRTTASGLNFRDQPSTAGKLLTDPLPYWTPVTVTEIKNGWGKVEYQGKSGWISLSYTIFCEDIVFSVYYYTDKGTAPLPQRKLEGETLTIVDEVPEYRGYRFLGWVDESASTAIAYLPGDTYSADATVSLRAAWAQEEYSIVFKNEDGTLLSSGNYLYGDRVVIPEAPVKESDGTLKYTFLGWDKEVAERADSSAVYTAVFSSEEMSDSEKAEWRAAHGIAEEKSGCGSDIGVAGTVLIAMSAFAGAALPAAGKKKKNNRKDN